MRPRINYSATAPGVYDTVDALDQYLAESSIDRRLQCVESPVDRGAADTGDVQASAPVIRKFHLDKWEDLLEGPHAVGGAPVPYMAAWTLCPLIRFDGRIVPNDCWCTRAARAR